MSAAAAKRTALAAASIVAFATLAFLVPAGGASSEPDTQSPTTPSNLRVTSATPSQVSVAWDPSTDDVGVHGYEVRGNQTTVTVDEPKFTMTGLQCGQSTRVKVVAFDNAQNRSGKASITVATTACLDTQPPSPPNGFTQIATTPDAVVLGWSASPDNVGVVEYGVYRNLQRVTTTTDPTVTLSSLACGSTYPYLVDSADAAGNRSSQASVYVRTADCPTTRTDTTPPTTPTALAPSGVTTTALSLNWKPSSDNVGVAAYDVYNNGAKVASPTTTKVSQSGLACGTTYTLKVSARDAAGNSSGRAKKSVSTNECPSSSASGDTTPPSTPTGLAASGITQTGFSLSWRASTDDAGVSGYDVYRNGTKVASPTSTSAAQSGLSCETAYAIAVVARDAAGNASQPAQLNAATAPCSTQSPPPPPPSDLTAPSQPSALAVSGATRTSVSLTWNASTDNVGVSGYRTYLNGATGPTSTQTNATVGNLTCGTAYTFQVEAYDAAGNRSGKASATGATSACPDTAAPTAPTNVVATSRTATSIALSWSSSADNVGVTGYGLYLGGTSAGTSSTTAGIFSGLSCGTNYTLAVDAYDGAANRSAQSVVMVSTTACPDTTPPSVPPGITVSNVSQKGLDLSWNASTDNVGVTSYDVYRNGTKVATVTSAPSAQSTLACGTSYSFGVIARDAAGNSSGQASLQASTAACASTASSAPITITTGGTYTGNWVSTSSTPAVTIATSQPVTIANSTVSNLAGGVLIEVPGSAQGNITVDHVRAYGGNGRFVHAEAFKSVTIKNCTIDKTAGIDLRWPIAGSSVSVTKNSMHNVQPGPSNSHRQFVQLNEVTAATVDISWNEVTNVYGESRVEDTISLYKSSNAQVHDNFIDGGYPLTTDSTHSGMGIIIDGTGGNFNKIYGNQVVSYTNGGIAISSGHDNSVYSNRIVSDGKTDDGVSFAAANIGVYIRNYASDPAWGSNSAHDNVIGYMHYGSPLYRNDTWLPDCSGNCSNQSLHAGAITKADEDAEVLAWRAKLASASITLGA